MLNKNQESIDKWFRETANSHEEVYPEGAWEEFQQVWQAKSTPIYRQPVFWYAAASLLITVSLLGLLWQSQQPSVQLGQLQETTTKSENKETKKSQQTLSAIKKNKEELQVSEPKRQKSNDVNQIQTSRPKIATKALSTSNNTGQENSVRQGVYINDLDKLKTPVLLSPLERQQLLVQFKSKNIENNELGKERLFHFGVVSPFCSNGKEAANTENTVSLNVLAGVSSGNKGIAVSGLTNYDRKMVKGVQIAGLMNYAEDLEGGQVSAISNVVGRGDLDSTRLFINQNASKFQIAGFSNTNLSPVSSKLQIAGFVNKANKVKGLQIASTANLAGEVEGLQLSTALNVARKLNGTQIGLLNISDEVGEKGTPVGLISIVKKNGYQKFEVWGNETFHTNLAFKLGIRKFYNIFAIGGQINNDRVRWGLGYGFGTAINLNPSLKLNLDLISYHVNENGARWTRELNQLTQIRTTVVTQGKDFKLLVGPSINIFVSDYLKDGIQASNLAPWTFYNERFNLTRVRMWLGINIGVEL